MYISENGKKLMVQHILAPCALALVLTACDSTGQLSQTGPDVQSPAPIALIENSMSPPAETLRIAAAKRSENLFINGSFENQMKNGWDACGDTSKVSFVNSATDGTQALRLAGEGCIYQSVRVTSGSDLNLSCDAKINYGNDEGYWTGLGLSYYDEYWNHLGNSKFSVVSTSTLQTHDFLDSAPSTTAYASMWFYTNRSATIDNCSLIYTDQQPTEYLQNSRFESGNDRLGRGWNSEADGWVDGCNGFAQQMTNNNGSGTLVVGEGACLHQRLSDEVLLALQGNYFDLSCTYNKTSDHYALLATNLTDRRRLTGRDEELQLSRTSYEEFTFDSATIQAKASDYLVPGDVFVMLGNQGPAGTMFVSDCSLTIIDDPNSK